VQGQWPARRPLAPRITLAGPATGPALFIYRPWLPRCLRRRPTPLPRSRDARGRRAARRIPRAPGWSRPLPRPEFHHRTLAACRRGEADHQAGDRAADGAAPRVALPSPAHLQPVQLRPGEVQSVVAPLPDRPERPGDADGVGRDFHRPSGYPLLGFRGGLDPDRGAVRLGGERGGVGKHGGRDGGRSQKRRGVSHADGSVQGLPARCAGRVKRGSSGSHQLLPEDLGAVHYCPERWIAP